VAGIKPTIGRIVHYVSLEDVDGKYPPEVQAAIITKVKALPAWEPNTREEDRYFVSLHVFYDTGDFFVRRVPFSGDYERGHWTWRTGEV